MTPWRLILLAVLVNGVLCMIEEIPLPADIQECLDQVHTKTNLTEVVGENVVWRCVHGSLWKKAKENPNNQLSDKALKWFATLINKSVNKGDLQGRRSRARRQTARLRVRREYRMLSDTERNNFHQALIMLKADTSIPPNRFDSLGLLHQTQGIRSHDGPNFLGWHRLFLIMAENALREKIPTVTIPYWDSTLDGALPDPRASIFFSPEFMGDAIGAVDTGPFSGWRTPIGPLIRHFGQDGYLMNWTSIKDVFTRSRLEEITAPHAASKYNIEQHHAGPHLWVGGYMSPQALAGYDPIFYLHHSFVDLIWELFRNIQRRGGVDPTTDYPTNITIEGHGGQDQIGFNTLTNRDALSDYYTTTIYSYQLPPTCTTEQPDCGSPYLHCDTSGTSPRCVSVTIFDPKPSDLMHENGLPMNGSPRRNRVTKRSANQIGNGHLSPLGEDTLCKEKNWDQQYTNNYFIDGVIDKKLWAYIPIGIIFKNDDRTLLTSENKSTLAVYSKCIDGVPISPHVTIESNGLSYEGMYKEITPVDKDLPIFSTTTFIGVKSPNIHGSDVLISAYDACGRVCQAFCRDMSSKGASLDVPCSGAIRITHDFPLLYGRSASEVAENLFKIPKAGAFPEFQKNEIFLQFYCKQEDWPWKSKFSHL
ncbi:hypothetical protein CHS0354_013539 [Potamilus streckersoni]|uniref:Tyrosinase copper-binding domain-containing protein n=1 Tax=Potamilus streckersoni TaxID=2493646 RepID=A0AAE0T9H2_9BIVA|nr:hypothetical protein CHS0354_013539 [Potamilus streckersoni]